MRLLPASLVGFCLLVALGAVPAQSLGPENVAVVVNIDSWASVTVANAYVELRQIPPANVVHLDGLADTERMAVADFKERILGPVLDTLTRRGLAGQIDCIAYSCDLPWAIDATADVGQYKLPQTNRPIASITGLTYLYRRVMAADPGYMGFSTNRYMRQPLFKLPGLTEAPQRRRFFEGMRLAAQGRWLAALGVLEPLRREVPEAAAVHYQAARCLAALERRDEALAALIQAVERGFYNVATLRQEPVFGPLRQVEGFKALERRLAAGIFAVQPTFGFSNRLGWDPYGRPLRQGGERYLLSTVLGVTGGRGNSVEEVLAYLEASARADGTRPQGTVYFMKSGDVRSTTRQPGFAAAVEALRAAGVGAEVVEGDLPQGRDDVIGLMAGVADFDWAASGSRILPGAICEHLTSAGGVLAEGVFQTPLTEFLRFGAAGASGTVAEPYALQQKFPFPFVHVHYVRGSSLAEAFYQAVEAPYQLLIVGDPLCRPWGRVPEVRWQKPQVVGDTLVLVPTVAEGPPVGHYQVFVDGRRRVAVGPQEPVTVDLSGTDPGHHQIAAVAVAGDPIGASQRASWPVMRPSPALLTATALAATVAWDRPLRLQGRLPGAVAIDFLHLGRVIARVEGDSGTVAVDARRLGLGPTRLQPVGRLEDGTVVRGAPLQIAVTRPMPTTGWPALLGRAGRPGLLLQTATTQRRVASAQGAEWLAATGLEEGEVFMLEGFFTAVAGIHRLQWDASMPLRLDVGGQQVVRPGGSGWQALPLALASGVHRLRLWGRADAAPRLRLRLGHRGLSWADSDEFFCLPRGGVWAATGSARR